MPFGALWRCGRSHTMKAAIWQEANEKERWIIASDLLDEASIYPDHLEVKVSGAPRMNVTLQEVGLTGGVHSCQCWIKYW